MTDVYGTKWNFKYACSETYLKQWVIYTVCYKKYLKDFWELSGI